MKDQAVPPQFLETANKALENSPEKIDPITLAMLLYELFQLCKKEFLRKNVLVAARRPKGMVAKIIRHQIEQKLPKELQTDIVIDPIIQATIYAAKDKKLWDALYELKDQT